MNNDVIAGFSKLTKARKIEWLTGRCGLDAGTAGFLSSWEAENSDMQNIIAGLSENLISNFHMPFCIAPNFLVNGAMRVFPLVTEESSVVAALAKAAAFWAKRGGFHAEALRIEKKGQLHFLWKGKPSLLIHGFGKIRKKLMEEAAPVLTNMEKRGGGVTAMSIVNKSEIQAGYYQIDVSFDTCDAMGANFINSCLEQFGRGLKSYVEAQDHWKSEDRQCEIIMAVLSNYTPGSRVRAWVECPVTDIVDSMDEVTARRFAEKFVMAVNIAREDISRAVTSNKGIFNGIDALAIATGNDFRALEAGGHAFAARNGRYETLSGAAVENGQFMFSLELPLSAGVVGGVTSTHPMARLAMKILGNPTAATLMKYMAVAGLAANWSATSALITDGIQKGHMKMHMSNILNSLGASNEQKEAARLYFRDRVVSYAEVGHFLRESSAVATPRDEKAGEQ